MNYQAALSNWRHKLMNDERLQSKLGVLAFSLISACPVILIATYSYMTTSRELTTSELSRRQAVVKLAAATVEEKLNRLSDLGVSLATRVRFRQLVENGDWEEAVKILETVPKSFPFVDRLLLADAQGVVRADTPVLPGGLGTDLADRDWYQAVKASGKPYVSGVYQRAIRPQHHIIAIAVPITNVQGARIGILAMQIRSDTFLNWIKSIDTGSRGFLFLVDRQGKTVAHPQWPASAKIVDYSSLPPVRNALQGRHGVEDDIRTESGARQVLAYEPVTGYGWAMALEQSHAGAFDLVDRSLRRLLIAYAAVGLGSVVIVYLFLRSFLFARNMTTALSESREQFHAVAETANDGIITADSEGKIIYFNQAAGRIFGYAAEELLGQPLTVIMPARFHEAHRRGFERFLAERKAKVMSKTVELAGRRKDGGEFPLELSLANRRTDKGLFFTGVLRDITDRKRLEDQLRSNNELLQAQNREIQQSDRHKSEFLANMSHELRTPLNAIIGFAELMHDGKVGAVADDHKEYLGDILISARHLLELINDVLDLSKVEAGKMEFKPAPVKLTKITEEVSEILRALAASRYIRILVDVDPAVDDVFIDPAKLKQVLYNYLSNALKFGAENSDVFVRAKPDGTGRFRVEVEDQGIGIRTEDVGTLFREFQQLDSSFGKKHQGTGLGLALTRKIVEAQGGEVGVDSVLGRGSRFFALLPRRVGSTEKIKQTFFASPLSRPPVLVIEDTDNDRKRMTEILLRHGYGVEIAATGSEAIVKAREKMFSAILLDLILPDMVGWQILHTIRSEGPNQNTPIIVTTIVTEKDAARGFPIQDFLSKPVEPQSLINALARTGVQPPKTKGRVLVVDDDPNALKIARVALEPLGYQTICHVSSVSGLAVAEHEPVDAVILDLLMPEMDGFEFLERLRESSAGRSVPVIVWTNQDLSAAEIAQLALSAQSVALKSRGGIDAVVKELQLHLSIRG